MSKKILYTVIAVIIFVILALVWKNYKKENVTPIANENLPAQINNNQSQNDSPKSINDELDKMEINAGIDTDLNSVDKDIKTL